MIKNGISETYIILFCLSILLFGTASYFYFRFIKNLSDPKFFMEVLFLDISILVCFIYSMIGKEYSVIISYVIWIIIPLRNIMVYYSILYKIK